MFSMCDRNHGDRRDDSPGFHWAIMIREIRELVGPQVIMF